MRIAFYVPAMKAQELMLVEALRRGGFDIHVIDTDEPREGYDGHMLVGVKSRPIVKALRDHGWQYVYWDKAYNRDWPMWWRFAINAHQPIDFLEREEMPVDRANAQGWIKKLKAWRGGGKHVLFAGASSKYNHFHGLGCATEYARVVVADIVHFTRRKVIYRPKPSWKGAEAVEGAHFSRDRSKGAGGIRRIQDDLAGAWCLITHGSSACFEALMEGIPTICLGDAIVRPISSTDLEEIEDPKLATVEQRHRLLANLAYCQWSLKEIASGIGARFVADHMQAGY